MFAMQTNRITINITLKHAVNHSIYNISYVFTSKEKAMLKYLVKSRIF